MKPEATPGVVSSDLLDCGHPGDPNNLLEGNCGTCKQADDLENLAKTADGTLKPILLSLAERFRNGELVYDTNGKTLFEWEKVLSPRPNCDYTTKT